MERKVNVVEDLDGNKIVVIHDIRFKGKRSVEWTDVEQYLKQYVTRFALPVYDENGDIERYNVFRAIVLVRHAEDDKLYLYDIMKIKKETSTLFQS